MRTLSKKQKIGATIAAAGVLAVAGGGIAFAYWSSTGTGSGSATTGTSSTWAVTTDAATDGPLTPGGPTESIAYHVKNNSTGYQKLNTVVISVANSDGTTWNSVSGCSAADYILDSAAHGQPTTDSPNVDLAPSASYDGTITIQMYDSSSDQVGCKGATVPLYLSAS